MRHMVKMAMTGAVMMSCIQTKAIVPSRADDESIDKLLDRQTAPRCLNDLPLDAYVDRQVKQRKVFANTTETGIFADASTIAVKFDAAMLGEVASFSGQRVVLETLPTEEQGEAVDLFASKMKGASALTFRHVDFSAETAISRFSYLLSAMKAGDVWEVGFEFCRSPRLNDALRILSESTVGLKSLRIVITDPEDQPDSEEYLDALHEADLGDLFQGVSFPDVRHFTFAEARFTGLVDLNAVFPALRSISLADLNVVQASDWEKFAALNPMRLQLGNLVDWHILERIADMSRLKHLVFFETPMDETVMEGVSVEFKPVQLESVAFCDGTYSMEPLKAFMQSLVAPSDSSPLVTFDFREITAPETFSAGAGVDGFLTEYFDDDARRKIKVIGGLKHKQAYEYTQTITEVHSVELV